MTNLSDRIRSLATGQAVFFRLKLQLADGSVRLFPPEEGGYYKVGEAPYNIPAGSYVLCFYDSELRPLVQSEQRLLVQSQAEQIRGSQGQLPLNFNLAGNPGGAGAVSAAAATAIPTTTVFVAQSPASASSTKPSEGTSEADLEFRKHLHTMDMEDRQQDFIRNSTYIKEVGELFVLNRIMRRDMMEMQRSMVMHAQHAYRDIEQVKTTVQGLLDLEIKVVSHVEKRLNSPPVPPPDYLGLGNSAIALLRDVSVALIQRGQPERPSSLPVAQPQLPPANSAPTPEISPPAEVKAPGNVLEQMGQKLRALSEMDLAQAMSSPEAWAGLLQSLVKPETPQPSGAKESSPKVPSGSEG